jgi:hypothetical protein
MSDMSEEERDMADGDAGSAEGSGSGRDADTGGGVTVGGSLTGGAVATGRQARAKDSSRIAGPSSPDSLEPVSPYAPPPTAPPGGLAVGHHMTGGAVATGPGSEAEFSAVRIEPRYAELLAAIDTLSSHLPLLTRSPEGDALAGTLHEARQDITTTGRVPRVRLHRLREQLTTSNAALAALTSAVAVAEAVRELVS